MHTITYLCTIIQYDTHTIQVLLNYKKKIKLSFFFFAWK